jgi:hypothetical protein
MNVTTKNADGVETWLVAAWRIIGSLLVSLLFVIVFMTASAQQRSVSLLAEQLKDNPNKISASVDYSTALDRVNNAEVSEAALKMLLKEQEELGIEQRRREVAYSKESDREQRAWERISPIVESVSKVEACEIPEIEIKATKWASVVQCAAEGVLTESLAKKVSVASDGSENYSRVSNDQQLAESALKVVNGDLERKRAEVTSKQTEVDQGQAFRQAFGDLNVPRKSWLFGKGVLVEFPPSLMQIILASVSGAFGALLITLVLIVYPNNKFDFVRTDGHEARILLGALIALCAYIVLGGGASVLGDGQAFEGGKANVMTFSAVGILAGMFSDRVAAWLSRSANTFFVSKTDTSDSNVKAGS